MDLAKWWNTNGQLGRYGDAAVRRGLPRTHSFAQARSVAAVAAHRCDEVFSLASTVTLWRLPARRRGAVRRPVGALAGQRRRLDGRSSPRSPTSTRRISSTPSGRFDLVTRRRASTRARALADRSRGPLGPAARPVRRDARGHRAARARLQPRQRGRAGGPVRQARGPLILTDRADVVSSFTVIKGAMIEETYAVFAAWDFDASKRAEPRPAPRGELHRRVAARRGCATSPRSSTAASTRRPRPGARVLAKGGCPLDEWKPLLLWHMTRDEFLSATSCRLAVRGLRGRRVSRPARRARRLPGRPRRARRRHRARWTEATRDRVAAGLLKIAADFGLLRGSGRRRSSPATTCRSAASSTSCTRCGTTGSSPEQGHRLAGLAHVPDAARRRRARAPAAAPVPQAATTRSPAASCSSRCPARAPASTRRGWSHERARPDEDPPDAGPRADPSAARSADEAQRLPRHAVRDLPLRPRGGVRAAQAGRHARDPARAEGQAGHADLAGRVPGRGDALAAAARGVVRGRA